MILRTITDDATGATKSIGLFGKTLEQLKKSFANIKQNGLFNSIFNTSSIDKNVIDTYNKAIIEATNNGATFAEKQQIMQTAMANTNRSTAQLIGATKGAIVETEALTLAQEQSTLAAKAQSIVLKTGSIAGNMLLFMAISKGISLAVTAIDDYIHRIDNLKEAAEEAKSAIDTIKSDFDSLTSTTNDVKERFAELAQGVENLGKVNQSRGALSTDDYDKFLDLSNQLAELFPQLTKGYDDNGNAILDLSGNVDTIVGSLDNLVSVQQKLANQEILEKMPDVWTGYTVDLDEYEDELNDAEKKVKSYQAALNKLLLDDDGKITVTNSSVHQSILEAAKKIGLDNEKVIGNSLSALYSVHNSYYGGSGKFKSAEWDFSSLTESQFDQLKNELGTLGAEYEDAVQLAKGKIEAANSEMSSYINTWLSTDAGARWNFSKMSSDMQNVVKDVLLNSDWISSIPDNVDADNWDDVSNWLQQEFLYAINKIDNEEIQTALVNAFNGEFTVEALQEVINQLLKAKGFDQNNPLIIYLQTKLDDKNALINSVKAKLKDGEDKGVSELSEEDLEIASEKIGVDDGILLSWDELIAKIEEYKASFEDADDSPTLLSVSSTIDQLNTQLKPAFDTLKSAYQDIFTDDGFDLNSIDILSTCDSIKSELDELDEIEGITIDYSSYEDFVKVLINSESTEQDVESAFNALATTIAAVGITGAEDLNILQSVLNNLGVENSELVAFQALTQNTEALKEAGLDLQNAEYDKIKAFAEETVTAENVSQALLDLYLAKLALSDEPITSTDDIQQLINIAEAAGVAEETIQRLKEIETTYASTTPLNGNYLSTEGVQAVIDERLHAAEDLSQILEELNNNSIGLDWAEHAKEDAKNYTSSFMSSFETELAKLSEKSFNIDGTLYFTMDTEDILGTIENIKSLADDIGAEIDFSDVHSVDDLNAKLEDLEEQYIDTYVSSLKLEDSDLSDMLQRSIKTCIQMKAHLEGVNTSLDTIQSNYSDLMDALETYNQTGFISIDQLQTLLEMDDRYVALLIDEGDQLRFNENGYKAIFKAKIDEAKALALEQYNTSIARLETEAHQRVLNESSKDGGVISRFIDKLREMGRTAVESSGFLSWMKDKILEVKNASAAVVNNTEYTPPSYGAWDAQFDQDAKQAEDALKVRLKAIDDIWNASQNSGNWETLFGRTDSNSSDSNNTAKDIIETFDWIETAIQRTEESISRLSSTAGSAYKTFSTRTKALLSEMSSVRSEINLQQQAYNRYMQQANDVGLSSAWAARIRNGAIDISPTTDENLADQINEYQEW